MYKQALLNKRILIIDDSPVEVELIESILKNVGCLTASAGNGTSALNKLKANRFDLILLDIVMPDIDGLTLLKRVQKDSSLRDIPTIIISGLSAKEKVIEGLEIGAVDYIVKPFHHQELVRRISIHLRLRAANEALRMELVHRDQVEKNLATSEKRFKSLFYDTHLIALIVDVETRKITDASRLACKFYGYSSTELTSLTYDQITIMPANELKEIMRKILDGKMCVSQYKHRLANGELKDVEVRSGLFIQDDRPFIFSVVNDVSERVKAEHALIESNEKVMRISMAAHDAIIMVNSQGLVTFWNKAAEKTFGYTQEEILGVNIHSVIAHPMYKEKISTAFQMFEKQSKESAIGRTVELIALRKGGEEFPVELSMSAIRDNDEWHAISIIRDISERKRTEQILKESETKLKQSNATKDLFFSIIAHDLRNPFNSIIGISDLLLKNHQNYTKEKITDLLEAINSSSVLAYELLENLLAWASTQTNSIKFNPQNIDLQNVIANTCNLLKSLAIKKGVDFIIPSGEKCIVYADINMVETILRNLITNAVKFTKAQGQITLSYSKNETYCTISVRDTGIGIKEENIEKLFEINTEYQRRGTDSEGGSGLGLILCKEFVKIHGGRIWIESFEGKGTTVYFTLPNTKP